MAAIYVYLLNQHGLMEDPTDSIIYGPSTNNKIERWWRDLRERLEAFFTEENTNLLTQTIDTFLRMFLYQLSKECDIFSKCWNSHRNSGQDKVELPTGVAKYVFSFSEQYKGNNMGIRSGVTRN